MSEEQRQRLERDSDYASDGSENSEIEDLEAGNGASVSNRAMYAVNDSVNTGQDLQSYVAEGIEVQASDVLTIEEMPEESCSVQKPDEYSETEIIYQFPTEFDEENNSQLPEAYSDNTDNLDTHEEIEISDLDEIQSIPQIYVKQQSHKIQDKEKQDIPGNEIWMAGGASKATTVKGKKKIVEGLKAKTAPVLEMQLNKCKVVRSPHMPVFEFNCIKKCGHDVTMQNFKFTDYGSDEFADIEDNRDSSSSSNTSNSNMKTEKLKPLKGLDRKSKQGRKADIFEQVKALKELPIICSSSSENSVSVDKPEEEIFPSTSSTNSESSSSYFSQDNSKKNKMIPTVKTSNETKKRFKSAMETIEERPECEDDAQTSRTRQAAHSKGKTLKMKARVGNRKDKCNVCNVRLGLCAIRCRCGGYYCAKHRYDKEHNCTFDYRTMGAEEIRKNNPRVIAEKIRKL